MFIDSIWTYFDILWKLFECEKVEQMIKKIILNSVLNKLSIVIEYS